MSNNFRSTNHSYLRYANCWEDADVLLKGLDIQSTDKVISILSAGDNTFSILSKSPQKVVAVDVNSVQLFLGELKKACFLTLTHSEFLEFLGFEKSLQRLALFEKVKVELSTQCLSYWEANKSLIEKGIIYQGKFENYFRVFSSLLMPLIHRSETIAQLFAIKTNEEQADFYIEKWNTWRWRLLFRIFFSKTIMGKFGRDKALFKEVDLNVMDYLLGKVKSTLSDKKCQLNYFLNFIIRGDFGPNLPHYARHEDFENIKNNCHKLEFKLGLLEDVLTSGMKFDKFNLSNIFEYLSPTEFKNISNVLLNHSNENAVLLNWSLMVKRRLNSVSKSFSTLSSDEIGQTDLGFFYNEVSIHKVSASE
jgi:S-adenosylmethionine-diacylglycerol 3-amino-3-carboxypropyl transferase